MATDTSILKAELNEKLSDPRFWLLITFFVMGMISIIASIDTNWIIIGDVANWLDDILVGSLFGPALVAIISVLISVFFFQFMLALISGELQYLKLRGFLTSVLIIAIMFFLLFGIKAILGEGAPGQFYSITPFEQLIGGP